jgi:nucleoside-triphosphatase THEP1
MKILLTGRPKSGKSTMLAQLLSGIEPKHGLFSPEVREREVRIGFDLQDERGKSAILSRTDKPTGYPVGRYFVDLSSLESFIEHLFVYTPEQLLFIDEIGQMQLYSDRFMDLVRDFIDSPNDFIGTISQVFDHPFIEDLKKREDILFCTVTPENRDALSVVLAEALRHRALFNRLPRQTQQAVLDLAQSYLSNNQYLSLRKLFKNAVPYVAANKVQKQKDGFIVQGITASHEVHLQGDHMICDCDFFNGRGRFASKAGECSHIQSAKLISS